MAFTVTKIMDTTFGNKRIKSFMYVNDAGSTGGTIVTGLNHINTASVSPLGAAVQTNAPSLNATLFPQESGSLVIVTDANTSGVVNVYGR